MQRSSSFLFSLALLSAAAATSLAQNAVSDGPDSAPAAPPSNYVQGQAAPIQRTAPNGLHLSTLAAGQPLTTTDGTASAGVLPGVMVRVGQNSSVRSVSTTDADVAEVRVEHGRANVSVDHPEGNPQILVDLPGGQVALVQDGFYTFNADTNTVRVLHGEAQAFAGQSNNSIKIKDNQQLVLGANGRASEVGPNQARADLVLDNNTYGRNAPAYQGGGGGGYYGDGGSGGNAYYGDAYYGDGYYGYPYFAYGYPYGYYPYWGWGYPWGVGFGWGWGWGGGYYRGGYGYRGGYRGGYAYRGGYGGGYHGGGYAGGGFHGGGGGGGFHGGGGGGHR